jgi:hypothetical protein
VGWCAGWDGMGTQERGNGKGEKGGVRYRKSVGEKKSVIKLKTVLCLRV